MGGSRDSRWLETSQSLRPRIIRPDRPTTSTFPHLAVRRSQRFSKGRLGRTFSARRKCNLGLWNTLLYAQVEVKHCQKQTRAQIVHTLVSKNKLWHLQIDHLARDL